MIDIGNITVLNDIKERLLQITDRDIEKSERRLAAADKSDEDGKLLGVLTSQSTRALWALQCNLESESKLEAARAAMAESPEIEKDLMRQAVILSMLGDTARELFWTQAKLDLDAGPSPRFGIRRGWELLEFPVDDENPMSAIIARLGGRH